MSGPAKAVLVAVGLAFGLALSAWLGRLKPSAAPPQRGADAGETELRYRRIICMSPAVAEIAFAVGAGPRVVAVSQHTKYPPEALDLPTCGGFFNPNRELILGLAPDLVITQGAAEDLRRFASEHGIALVSLELTDLESVLRAVEQAGVLLQVEARAALVAAEMRYRLARVRLRASESPPVPALLVTGREPEGLRDVYVAGPGTFLHDVLELAGGRNVCADMQQPYGVVSKEALLERAPEVIVELQGEGGDPAEATAVARRAWSALPALPAVAEGRVYVIVSDYAMIPGPRVVELAERLVELLHVQGGGDG